jgi:hypothetical protein
LAVKSEEQRVKKKNAKSEIQNMKCCEKENADSGMLEAKIS